MLNYCPVAVDLKIVLLRINPCFVFNVVFIK